MALAVRGEGKFWSGVLAQKMAEEYVGVLAECRLCVVSCPPVQNDVDCGDSCHYHANQRDEDSVCSAKRQLDLWGSSGVCVALFFALGAPILFHL